MAERNNGGPAFPVVADNGLGHIADGMSLRDWFAGQAIIGFTASYSHPEATGAPHPSTVADWAYDVADAMLGARESGE